LPDISPGGQPPFFTETTIIFSFFYPRDAIILPNIKPCQATPRYIAKLFHLGRVLLFFSRSVMDFGEV
jgi:hypothetical protein